MWPSDTEEHSGQNRTASSWERGGGEETAPEGCYLSHISEGGQGFMWQKPALGTLPVAAVSVLRKPQVFGEAVGVGAPLGA